MNNLVVFLTFSILVTLSCAIEFDFCVGDLTLPTGPNGYACKNPAKVTADDFIYTGFRGERTTTNIFRANVTFASANAYPGLNGLGISMSKVELGVGGVIPAHTHRTSELIVVVKGSIIAGFISTNNTAYYKRLEVGDVMIFPKSLIHFQANVGLTSAIAYASYNGANPGTQIITTALFAGNLPTDIITRTTLLTSLEITKLKTMFGTA